jgi:two-component sensor histidine kinase
VDLPSGLRSDSEARDFTWIYRELSGDEIAKDGFSNSPAEITAELHRLDRYCSLVIPRQRLRPKTLAREGSLGLRLMKSLVRQIDGRSQIDGWSGTLIPIEWPLASGA